MAIPPSSKPLMEWIEKLGLNPKLTRRIVIDIPHEGVATIYAELFMSSEVLELELPPEIMGAKIKILENDKDTKWGCDE